MAKKHKKEKFKLTVAHLFRWAIFSFLVYLLISYLSTASNNLSINLTQSSLVLGSQDLSKRLPEPILENINQLSSNPLYKTASDKFVELKNNLPQFINRQTKQIQKEIINQVYDQIIKSIEKK